MNIYLQTKKRKILSWITFVEFWNVNPRDHPKNPILYKTNDLYRDAWRSPAPFLSFTGVCVTYSIMNGKASHDLSNKNVRGRIFTDRIIINKYYNNYNIVIKTFSNLS